MDDRSDHLSDAARRGMQRAAVHLMKAAIEVIEGLSAFLEEMGGAGKGKDGDSEDGPEHFDIE